LFHSIDKVEKAAEKHYKWAKCAKHEPSEPTATSVLVRWDGRCVDQGLRPEASKVGQSETGPDPAQPTYAGWMICRDATLFHWHSDCLMGKIMVVSFELIIYVHLAT
jgi:hypothetical protein